MVKSFVFYPAVVSIKKQRSDMKHILTELTGKDVSDTNIWNCTDKEFWIWRRLETLLIPKL